MTLVNTVTGAVPGGELGLTLLHEHVFFGMDGVHLDSREAIDEEAVCREAVRHLSAAREFGLQTIVDATPIEMYRRPERLRWVSEQSGIKIVCATGLYTASHGVPGHFRHMSRDGLRELFEQELVEGIGDSGVRAGVLKVATSPGGVLPVEETILGAVADAQTATGAPILTHTSGSGGVQQLETLMAAGADPTKVVIGHLDHRHTHISTFRRILDMGAFVGIDRVGREVFLSDAFRAGLVAALVDEGHQTQVCLSMDSAAVFVGETTPLVVDTPIPYRYVLTDFRERLQRYGVGPAVLHSILVDNPARLFGAAG